MQLRKQQKVAPHNPQVIGGRAYFKGGYGRVIDVVQTEQEAAEIVGVFTASIEFGDVRYIYDEETGEYIVTQWIRPIEKVDLVE